MIHTKRVALQVFDLVLQRMSQVARWCYTVPLVKDFDKLSEDDRKVPIP